MFSFVDFCVLYLLNVGCSGLLYGKMDSPLRQSAPRSALLVHLATGRFLESPSFNCFKFMIRVIHTNVARSHILTLFIIDCKLK